MALEAFRLVLGQGRELAIWLDRNDLAHRDVLAHFSRGQLYEHETSCFFRNVLRPGDTVVDVGANAGYFTLLGAHMVGPGGGVLAIEATPSSAKLVGDNASLNGFGWVRVLPSAVSDQPGAKVFFVHGDRDSNGGVAPGKPVDAPMIDNDRCREFVVQATTLDAAAVLAGLDRIRLLKVDTEGHEIQVLSGASGLLARDKIDFIVCELNQPRLHLNGGDQWRLRALMAGHGFDCFLLDLDGGAPRLLPRGVEIVQEFTCNILFARQERVTEVWPRIRCEPTSARLVERR
jgi:FkbM family methyltransferase